MKQMLRVIFGYLAVGTLALATGPAQAQTPANGFYYPVPSWDQTFGCPTLTNCPRFIVLSNMSSAAVLDRETGLVWERSPVNISAPTWISARSDCVDKSVGARKGWRLPSVHELASLVDPSTSNPSLPAGHPFRVQSLDYWSATTNADDSTPSQEAWSVNFNNGNAGTFPKTAPRLVWCVRGGQNHGDAY
jgi:hypothetical protein